MNHGSYRIQHPHHNACTSLQALFVKRAAHVPLDVMLNIATAIRARRCNIQRCRMYWQGYGVNFTCSLRLLCSVRLGKQEKLQVSRSSVVKARVFTLSVLF
jgi:hypothetical protein